MAHNCKIEIFIGYFWMRWVVMRVGVYCPHLWAQLVKPWNVARNNNSTILCIDNETDDMFSRLSLYDQFLLKIHLGLFSWFQILSYLSARRDDLACAGLNTMANVLLAFSNALWRNKHHCISILIVFSLIFCFLGPNWKWVNVGVCNGLA